MTEQQKQTLAAALRAETDPSVVAALAIRNDVALMNWCNANSATDAWMASADSRTIFEAMNITKFDTLTAGKRDAYRLMIENAPLNFGRNNIRNAVVDIWGASDSVAVLQAVLEKARHAEVYLGGSTKTTNTVAGLDRNYYGAVALNDVSEALNRY